MTLVKSISGKQLAAFGLSLLTVSLFALPTMVGAQDLFGVNYGKNTGLGTQDPRETIARIINIVMGFLGIIAVGIILMGGFKWMLSQGNTTKVDEAKQYIISGVIGLAIVLSAYAIANFVVNQLVNATNAGR